VSPVGGEPAMRDWAAELVERARLERVELTGDDGLLTALVRQVLQTGLEVEMTDHLGYEPHAVEGRGSGNSRNGSYPKTVATEIGQVDLRVPRDRNATFDPVTVPKGQRRLGGLTGNVISLYAKGMTTGDIQAHLAEIYDTEISRDCIPASWTAVHNRLRASGQPRSSAGISVTGSDGKDIRPRVLQITRRVPNGPREQITLYGRPNPLGPPASRTTDLR
jgi:transposase-like protein